MVVDGVTRVAVVAVDADLVAVAVVVAIHVIVANEGKLKIFGNNKLTA